MTKKKFCILSLTWGLPLTLLGCVIVLILVIAGYKPKKHGYCYYIEVGNHWGGLELGLFFLTDKQTNTYIKNHEFGHGIQNCYWGPLMLPAITIPSAIRYWWRKFLVAAKIKTYAELPDYYSIWFEKQASDYGYEMIAKIGENK